MNSDCAETVHRLTDEMAEVLAVLNELVANQYYGGEIPEGCLCLQCVANRKAIAILKKYGIEI